MFARAKHFLLAAALAVPLTLASAASSPAQQPIPSWTTSYPVTTYAPTTTTSYYYAPYTYSYYPSTYSYYYGTPGVYYPPAYYSSYYAPYRSYYWGRPFAWRGGYRWWY